MREQCKVSAPCKQWEEKQLAQSVLKSLTALAKGLDSVCVHVCVCAYNVQQHFHPTVIATG